jgi:hypothetical protein
MVTGVPVKTVTHARANGLLPRTCHHLSPEALRDLLGAHLSIDHYDVFLSAAGLCLFEFV